ncbi:branched chain amino acid--2-keto-4-methylthiobutyrate aminotransferase [soil metagenome]
MHKFVFFGKEIFLKSDIKIPAVSSAALYGKSVFTTLAIKEKKAFLWEKHWRRLNDSAFKIGVDLAEFSEEFLTRALGDLIEKNEIENGRARITFFDESASRIWHFETGKKTSVLIMTADLREVPENLRLMVSPFFVNSTSPLAGIKSCNYLEHILALEDAKRRGFDEAVRINERGEIVSTCMANIFWRKDGKLFTPSLKTGCLKGTTREFVLENENGIEIETNLNALKNADEIFLTSAGLGICRVSEFDVNKKE